LKQKWKLVCAMIRRTKVNKKPFCPFTVYRLLGGMCRLHRQSRKVPYLLTVLYWCLAWLILPPWNWGSIFLRNIEWLSTDYMALYPRRQWSS
jgi:hypothetical protein